MSEVGAGDRIRGMGRGLIARPWVFIVLAGLVAFVVWAKGTRTQPHEVRAVFDEAVSLYPGLDVRVDGLDAGKIKAVDNVDGKAVITLGIKDDKIWPLHQGTKAVLRFGSTVGNGTRIVDVVPGPSSAPEIPENGIIANANTVETTEFDDLFDTFDTKTRANLQGTLKGTGDTFGPRASQLGQGIEATPEGLGAVGDLANDLDADEPALKAFIANTYRTTNALASRRDAISSLVGNLSTTMTAFANHTDGITGSLERFPSTSSEAQTTLRRLDTSVGHLDALVTDLRPGASELGRLAVKLRPALNNLRQTVPYAIQTFRTARRASPDIEALLRQAQPTSDKAAPALATFAPMAACIRPYAPEGAALLTEWTSFNQLKDSTSHLGRLWANVGATSFTSNPLNPKDYVAATGQKYALVRPPGLGVGKPQFQPECGVTQDGLDPAKDPEVGG